MKKEYDFSKRVRGKFYRKNTKLHVPVYLNGDNLRFVEDIAGRKNKDLNSVVNELIKQDQRIVLASS